MLGKRASITAVGLVLLVLVLTASALGKETVTVGTWITRDSVEWQQTYGPQLQYFEANNPDIGIDVVTIAGFGEYAAKISVLAATGDITDMLQIPVEQASPLVVRGILEDLDPWITRDTSLDTRAWTPSAAKAVRYAGIMFGMPGYVVNYTYAFNKDILAERGVVPPGADTWITWEQIGDIGKRTTVDVDGDGQPDVWGYYHGTSYTEMIPLIYQSGGRMFNDDGFLDIDAPSTYKGMNWLFELIRQGVHGGSRSLFYQGNVSTIRLGSWEMNNIMAAQTPIGVCSGIQNVTKNEVAYVTSFGITTNSKKKESAWRYAKYLTSREAQNFVAATPKVPMRRDVTIPTGVRPILTGLMNSLGYAEPYPYHIHSDYIQGTFNSMTAPIWTGATTPEAVVPEVQRTINAYIRQQNK